MDHALTAEHDNPRKFEHSYRKKKNGGSSGMNTIEHGFLGLLAGLNRSSMSKMVSFTSP